MQHKLLLSLSLAALLIAAPAFASPDTAPVQATVDGSAASTTAPADAPKDAAATEDNAMTKTDGDAQEMSAPEGHEAAAADDGGHHGPAIPQEEWSWEGPFGVFDRPQLQRGFQVYKQVCAACHGLSRVYFRNLSALGYNEAEIKSIAAETQVTDGPNDDGDMFERPGRPSDHFRSPFANDQAARAANGGALPPDLSLIVRARGDGTNYLHAILVGYEAAPEGFALNQNMHYNKYFPGHQIAMPQPLMEGSVTYEDGTTASIDQMSRDVTAFLTWASEPNMEKRKQVGLKVMLFMLVFAGLMYATKRKVWKDVH
jgi:ubiquinol-cytochrome c reductase cytochrome c1 subunit